MAIATHSWCDLKIRPDMIHLTPREMFMNNTHNNSEFIHLLSSTFQKRQIILEHTTMLTLLSDADTWPMPQMILLRFVVDILLTSSMITFDFSTLILFVLCSIFMCHDSTRFVHILFYFSCWHADNAVEPYLGHEPSTILNHVDRFLRYYDHPRRSLWNTEALLAISSRLRRCDTISAFDSILQVLYRRHW